MKFFLIEKGCVDGIIISLDQMARCASDFYYLLNEIRRRPAFQPSLFAGRWLDGRGGACQRSEYIDFAGVVNQGEQHPLCVH